jgi:hypothetical protein
MNQKTLYVHLFLLVSLGALIFWKVSKTSHALLGAAFWAWLAWFGSHLVVQVMNHHPSLKKRMLLARWLSTVYAITQHVFAVMLVLLTEPGVALLSGNFDSRNLIEFLVLAIAALLVGFVIDTLLEFFISLLK